MATGIRFSEVMAGPFALGVSEPEAGARAGESGRTRLTMHADVSIPNLDAFIDSPDHPGGLAGRIDFAPLGRDIVADRGVFNLFAPADRPDTKHMIYELGFAVAGERWYLAGRKEVRDDTGFDMWADTTTLLTTLHRGDDATAPVAGAGVLSLGVQDLMELLATVRVTGASSPLDIAVTLARFGNFFMGELWQTYAPRVLRAMAGRDRG
ncbi:MAG: hypothetical protein H6983_03950 [Ectothiorhodospiraceae bacterium]|nr:hypothetical protein [Chromatiales bacterium]MCP5153295.1 hypothetical protein [Ectothiorhodospiraceae bacterium]